MTNLKRQTITMFDQRYVDLQHELRYHPALCIKMAKAGKELEDKLACIATHLGIAIDKALDHEELHRLMEGFTQELRKQRSIIITPGDQRWLQ